ncbi:hypothetical protein GCM10020366_71090 [Saccharopolyspora gregorii]|uniref:Uncharacterized protein n=1 Tax=Saccharopolyspora gregorii TaxID=33914 RepID=A0ABP6S2Y4_9PSEU
MAREPRELGPHLDRLERSAALLDLPAPPREVWERATRAVIDAWPWDAEREMALKLVCSPRRRRRRRHPHRLRHGSSVGADTLRKRQDGVSAVTLDRGIASDLKERAPWLLLSAKTLSYATNMPRCEGSGTPRRRRGHLHRHRRLGARRPHVGGRHRPRPDAAHPAAEHRDPARHHAGRAVPRRREGRLGDAGRTVRQAELRTADGCSG